MKTLSNVLKTNRENSKLKNISSQEEFKVFVSESYDFDVNNVDSILEYEEDYLVALDKLKKFNEKELSKPVLNTENVKEIDVDENMQPFFRVLDILSGYRSFSFLYQEEKDNKVKWFDKEIIKSLKSINYYVEQLASYISVNHQDILPELNFPSDGFDNGKRLDTFIKQTDEFKELKSIIKKGIDFSNQSLTVRVISIAIIDKTKKFIDKISG